MYIGSELLNAQVEVLAGSDPATHIKGRIYQKSATEPLKIDDGTTFHKVVTDQTGHIPYAYHNLMVVNGKVPGLTGGGIPNPIYLGSDFVPNAVYLSTSDFPSITGKSLKLRIRIQLYTNDETSLPATFFVGLYPITRPATSGSTTLCYYTVGTMISGSAASVVPVADSLLKGDGSDFDVPANGHYILAYDTTGGSTANNSIAHVVATLQYHYV